MIVNLPVTWSVCGMISVEVNANTMEEAIKLATTIDFERIDLPNDNEYIDDSFELTATDTEELLLYQDNCSSSDVAKQFLFIDGKLLSSTDLIDIGNNIGVCMRKICCSYVINYEQQIVSFEFPDGNEKFVFDVKFEDLSEHIL